VNVAVDIKLLYKTSTGIAAFTKNLLSDVLSVPKDSNTYYLLSPNAVEYPEFQSKRTRYVNVKYPRVGGLDLLLYDQYMVLQSLKALRPDVFFSPYYDIPFFYIGRIITTIHDLVMLKSNGLYSRRFQNYYKILLKRAIKKSGIIITVSNASKKQICAEFPYADQNVHVFYHRLKASFYNVELNAELKERVQKKYHLPSEFILHSAGADPRKNLPRLLAAYARLVSKGVNMPPLVMIGSDKGRIEEAIGQLGVVKLQRQILLTGYVDEVDLPIVYSLCVFAVNASVHEGFGFPLIEAMASGKAICCSEIEAFREIGADVPVFFDPLNVEDIANKMQILMEDDSMRVEKERLGLGRAGCFKHLNNGERFVRLLNELV
jgi:glycosyltransferase involved in cell wall biosynthesis